MDAGKKRARRWLLGTILALGAIAGGVVWSAHARATAIFERHDRSVKEAIAAIRARPVEHPCLYEPVLSGDGWPAYVAAIEGFKSIPEAEAVEIPGIGDDPDALPDPEKLRAVLEKCAPFVEKLRESNRRRAFLPDYRYEDGNGVPLETATASFQGARMLRGVAMQAFEEGRGRDALEAVLLGFALAHDTARSGPVVNALIMESLERIAADALREMLSGHSFEAADLESFAGNLDRLLDSRPLLADAFVVDSVLMRRTLADLGMTGAAVGTTPDFFWDRSWRYLFSQRLAYAGALGELEQYHRELGAVSALPVERRPAAAEEVRLRWVVSRNPIVPPIVRIMSPIYGHDAASQMNLMLLRASIAIAWYEAERGVVPRTLEDLVPRYLPRVVPCPLTGKPLGYDHGKVWSAGRNGIDDGGTPGPSNESYDEEGDVVWRVKRE